MQGSHATGRRVARLIWAGGLVAALATSAAAQDYDIDTVTGKFQAKPSTATSLTMTEDNFATVDLPFSFPYFGKEYAKAHACDNGFIILNNGSKPTPYGWWVNSTFPTSNSGTNTDGMIAPLWNDYSSYSPYSNGMYTWTTGTSPNRVVYIHWEAVSPYASTTPDMTFQAQLHETSGRIIFAYATGTAGSGWPSSSSIGIDEPSGSRYATPSNVTNISHPNTDYEIDPDVTSITGSVSIAPVISDGTGFGNSQGTAAAAAGLRIELRSGGTTNASAVLGASGAYDMKGIALDSSQSGSVVLVAETLGCRVSPSTTDITAGTYSTSVATNVSYGNDTDAGPFVLSDTNDATGSSRAPMQIALHIDAIRSWVQTVTGAQIPKIEVFYDAASNLPTSYNPGGTLQEPYIRISGAAAANPDAFDGAVVARAYMRHVLTTLTGNAPSGFTQSIDARTSAQEAFADALGLYAHAVVTGETVVYDALSGSAANMLDLETPSLSTGPAPDVAGWAAAALFDLADADNESHDLIDGTSGSNADRPILVMSDLTVAATPDSFLDAWVDRGYSGSDLVTDFIHHGLLPDDANEPNDTRALAQDLGAAGLRAPKLVLNRYNEDWYRVGVPTDANLFYVEVIYQRFDTAGRIELEVFDTNGTLLNFGVPEGNTGPIRATMPNLPAGEIFVRVAHTGGATITDYAIQAYAQMSLALSSAPAWTVGKRIQEPLALFGGIPPFTVNARDAAGDPFSAIQFIPSQTTAPFDMVWTPKEVGNVTIQIVATDSGVPTHARTLNLNFIVNAELAFSAPELTGVALNKVADVNLGRIGGTDPITLSDEFGDLPGGLSIDEEYHIRGTASEPGGGAFGFTATDVAGSEAVVDSFLVVCVPIETKKQPVPLAGGQAAAGFYFDALAGSDCSMKLKTSKKRAKRELNFLVIGPDGNVVQGGKAKIKAGSVSVKGLALPTTGRYFMAFESDDGGPETELQGTLKLKLPKKSAGGFERMELDELYKIEFGALKGATLQVKGKTTEGMEVQVVFVVRPDGEVLPFGDTTVTNGNGKVTITTQPLPMDGTYQLYIRPQKTDLADFDFKYKIKQPKGGEFHLED